ncbi:amidohydrolase [Lichenibacterium dinghuense]|uniref:amidohydrolase n=1 Tax=Lichenibacterium dinghuense TaxID=2895977 RepID=UPI001F0155B0|nr:amidohydrolase [Lichenibacterium sp. 6Y81]
MSDAASIEALAGEVAEWRREIHRHPGIAFDVGPTASLVADKLRAFGFDEVMEGVGRTGVVGVLRGRRGGDRAVALRADMDALPIFEQTNLGHASREAGKMHACGHDGHTAMLLGAAKHLSGARDFAGTAVFLFQPAEETSEGALAMIEDGLFDRVRVDSVYGLHSLPGLPVGHFATRPGPVMASVDRFEVLVEARGAHAAMPHQGVDAVLVASQIVVALQSIVSRNLDPLEPAVVTVGAIQAGDAFNVLPDTARLLGTCRALTAASRDTIERRLREVAEGVARLNGAQARVTYDRISPATVNHAAEAGLAARVAEGVAGPGNADAAMPPLMIGEDFARFLEVKPGAFSFIGNGDTAGLHHPAYDFDDRAISSGIRYWVGLVEAA